MWVRRFVLAGVLLAASSTFAWAPSVRASAQSRNIGSPDAIAVLPARYRYTETLSLSNQSSVPADDVQASVILLGPQTRYSQVQLIGESLSPVQIQDTANGNVVGTFQWPFIGPHSTATLTLRYRAMSSEVSYRLPKVFPPYNRQSPVYQQYASPLRNAAAVDTGAPALRRIVQETTRASENPEQKARALFNWVVRNIRYNPSLQSSGSALDTLALGRGICSNFADLYVGLLRTAGIPARILSGYVTNNGNGEAGFHQWTSFYLPGAGWIVADPTWGPGYFAALQDHWHIVLQSGLGQSIKAHWRYQASVLTPHQALYQIVIHTHDHFEPASAQSSQQRGHVKKS